MFKTLTSLSALGLALLTGWHAYHSTAPSTSVEQYAKEQRAGLVRLEMPLTHGLRSDTYNAGGLHVKCPSVGSYTKALLSFGEGRCE